MNDNSPNRPEPPPLANNLPGCWQAVIGDCLGTPAQILIPDMEERDAEGRRKYGTPLQPHNGRRPRIDAFQEALDLVVYSKQAVMEGDGAMLEVYEGALSLAVRLKNLLLESGAG